MYMYNIYSNDQTQPNTRAYPKSEPQVRFGSTLGLLGVRSESTRGSLCVHSTGFPLRTQVWSEPLFVVTVRKPHPLYIPNTFCNISQKSFISEAIGSIHIFRIWPYIRHRIVTLSETVWINSKIQATTYFVCLLKESLWGKNLFVYLK